MGSTTIRIDAAPDEVYRQLTRSIDEVEPGPIKVGSQFSVQGKSEVFTVTVVEPPSRFGYAVLTGDVTTKVEYTILPDGNGSLVSVEMDQESPSSPLMVMAYGAFTEGRNEKRMLEDLKAAIEAGAAEG